MMRNAGWQQAAEGRVRRIWKEEGLKVPEKQHSRGRLWLNDGSCLRLRPEHRNHVWSYDFVLIRDITGHKIRMLTMIDEYSRTCLTVHCARRIGADEVIEQLANAMVVHGIPQHIRSDNGPEFIANRLRDWLANIGVKTAYIEPGSPWENGYCESFNGTLRNDSWMEISSMASKKHKRWWINGYVITTRLAPIVHLDTGRQHRRQDTRSASKIHTQ